MFFHFLAFFDVFWGSVGVLRWFWGSFGFGFWPFRRAGVRSSRVSQVLVSLLVFTFWVSLSPK